MVLPHGHALLGIGGNLPGSKKAMAQALKSLGRHPGLSLLDHSGLYKSAARERIQQPFLNMVALVQTSMHPSGLLLLCRELEHAAGRVQTEEIKGPRVLDIDIIAFGGIVASGKDLCLPHFSWRERRFVVEPFYEMCLNSSIEWLRAKATQLESLLMHLNDQQVEYLYPHPGKVVAL